MSNIMKFQYLKLSLDDEPKKCLDGLLCTNESYPRALKILKDKCFHGRIIKSVNPSV